MKKAMKQTKKIVFDVNSIDFAKAREVLSKKLKEIGIECIFVSYSKECNNYLKKRGETVIDIIEHFKKIKLPRDVEGLLEYYEKKYEVPSFNLTLLGDLNYTWLGRKKALEGLAKHLIFWENFLEKNKIDFIIGGTERFIHEVPRIVSKKFKTQYYVWKFPPINNNFIFLKDHSGRWEFLEKYWNENKSRPLTKEERKKVLNYISLIKKRKERTHLISKKPTLGLKDLKWGLQRAYANLVIEKLENPYGRSFLKIAKKLFGRALRKKIVHFWHDKPNFKEKYFFYPLHIPSDAQILVRSPQYKNQLTLLENLNNHLPIGYKLYVKEHPNYEGGTTISELRKIRKLSNVKVIDAKINSHDLIKNSKGIITINSNVGWEALLYEKPVIVLGKAFYDISGLTFNVRDFYELPEVIKKAVSQKFDREKMYKFVNATLTNILPGHMVHIKSHLKRFCEEENLKKIVEGFKKVLIEGANK